MTSAVEQGRDDGPDAGAQQQVAVLGGTGALGRGLAVRLALGGVRVVLGSRDAGRAQSAAGEIAATTGGDVTGASNEDAAAACDVAVLAVPWESHDPVLEQCRDALRGKVLVDAVNPLGFDARGAFALRPERGSACETAQALLPESVVVGAFHHVAAESMLDPSVRLDGDVLVVGDDKEAVELVRALVERVEGLRGFYAGRLRSAHQVEALTANLISINRRYRVRASLRVSGL